MGEIENYLSQIEQSAIVKRNSKEWRYMWKKLAEKDINKRCKDEPTVCENGYEIWQYMGSFKIKGKWLHEFRHRWHPITEARVYFKISASKNYKPIGKKRRLLSDI